jgi:hypothetical protein
MYVCMYVCMYVFGTLAFPSVFAAKSTIGFREPHLMLQFLSVCLSTSASYPVSVYGIIAVRDELEPMRNHLFNRPCRDDAVTIDKVIKPGLLSFHITCLLLKTDQRSTLCVRSMPVTFFYAWIGSIK